MLRVHLLEWCLHFGEYIWCPRFEILCKDMKYHFHILCKLKYQKYMYERLAFPCSWMTKFSCIWLPFWKEFYNRFVWGNLYDAYICTLIPIFSVIRNIRNPCVKGLHSHALEWLVFLYLASILKELYTRFVWGIFTEFDDDGVAINYV